MSSCPFFVAFLVDGVTLVLYVATERFGRVVAVDSSSIGAIAVSSCRFFFVTLPVGSEVALVLLYVATERFGRVEAMDSSSSCVGIVIVVIASSCCVLITGAFCLDAVRLRCCCDDLLLVCGFPCEGVVVAILVCVPLFLGLLFVGLVGVVVVTDDKVVVVAMLVGLVLSACALRLGLLVVAVGSTRRWDVARVAAFVVAVVSPPSKGF